MKKTIKIIVMTLFVTLLITGCGGKTDEQNSTPAVGSEMETASQEDDREIAFEDVAGESITVSVEEAKPESEEEPASEPKQEVIDINKLTKKKVKYDKEGTATETYIYTYDEKGLLLKEEYTDICNWEGLPQITEYTYDADGALLQTEFNATSGGYFYQKVETIYNSDGKVTQEEYESEGLKKTTDYLYDVSGNLLEENIDMDDMTIKAVYEYDSYGNVLSTKQWYSGEESTGRFYKYEYYENGTAKKKESYYG